MPNVALFIIGLARLLPFVGLAGSGYLSFVTVMEMGAMGCNGGSSWGDCDRVLHSRWSSWMGVPVAPMGMLVYSSLAGLCWLIGNRSPWIPAVWRTTLWGLVWLAAGAGIWFLGLQIFVIKGFCIYCVLTHASGVLLAAVWPLLPAPDLSKARGVPNATRSPGIRFGRQSAQRPSLKISLLAASALLCLLIVGQCLGPGEEFRELEFVASAEDPIAPSLASGKDQTEREAGSTEGTEGTEETEGTEPVATRSDATKPKRTLSLLNNKLRIDILEHPHLGEPDGSAVIVELADYTCHQCRDLHRALTKMHAKYGDQLTVVVLPCPLKKSCNKAVIHEEAVHKFACDLARLSIAVWLDAPTRFPEFHDWLMTGPDAPTADQALQRALQIVPVERLRERIAGRAVNDRIVNYTSLYGFLLKNDNKLGLPLQFVGSAHAAGMPSDEQKMFQFWEKHLPPPRSNVEKSSHVPTNTLISPR